MKWIKYSVSDSQYGFLNTQASRRGLSLAAFSKETLLEKATRYEKGQQPWESGTGTEKQPPQGATRERRLYLRMRHKRGRHASILRSNRKRRRAPGTVLTYNNILSAAERYKAAQPKGYWL